MVSLHAAMMAMALSGVGQQTVLYDFYADWCKPCRAMDTTVQALIAAGHPVQRINIDQNKPLAAKFKVQNIPCFVMVVDGREVDRVVGGTTFSRLERMCLSGRAAPSREASPAMLAQNPPATPENIPSPWRSSPAAAPVIPASFTSGAPETSDARLVAASVRLRVEDADGHSCGSGTIIDARGGEALILTCGHIFRDSQGKGRIEVDLFNAGTSQRVPGNLISFDLTRDVGLVRIPAQGPLPTARVAPPGFRLAAGQPVVSVGCNNGDAPTARRSQITSLDKFLGPPNIQVSGQPVEGRSGGGLFSADGLVLGVCNAADPSDKEGLYAALGSIYAELDRASLSFIYKTPASPETPPAMLAQAPAAAPPEAVAGMPQHEQAAMEEIRRKLKDGAEVVCVIRSRNNPGTKSEVIMLDRASPEFLKQLAAESQAQNGPHLTSLEVPKPHPAKKVLLEWSAPEPVASHR